VVELVAQTYNVDQAGMTIAALARKTFCCSFYLVRLWIECSTKVTHFTA
jgi:hypothetical protein